jgi:hypothetical protein
MLRITIVNHSDVEGVVQCVEAGAGGVNEAPYEEMRKAARDFSVDCLLPQYTAVIELAGGR